VQPSAWADFIDARLRLVHELSAEGHSPEAIALRISVPDARLVAQLLDTPTEPAIPGCSRHLACMWRDRAQALERELLGVDAPAGAPVITDIRELQPREDDE
jgi:hypothetical protein